MSKLDPAFCAFCLENSRVFSIGRMLVVTDGAEEVLVAYDDSPFGACENCALQFNGATAGEHEATGAIAVFRFQHHDFEKVAGQIDSFAVYLDSLKCHVCDTRIYEEGEPLAKIARRMLQFCPDAHYLKATCESCMAVHGCEDCDDHD